MDILLVVIAVLISYCIGSISFAVIFTRLFTKKDVRDSGSGNAGTTNVLRVAGIGPGLLTFICDALKGFVACIIGHAIFNYLYQSIPQEYAATLYLPIYGALLCGLFCMLGHIFPVFFQFKGGKAVAMAVGIFYVCNWKAITIALIVFAAVVLITRIVSLASLLATVTVFIVTLIAPAQGNVLIISTLTFIMCLMVFIKHIPNIKRLIMGEEKKIFSKEGKK